MPRSSHETATDYDQGLQHLLKAAWGSDTEEDNSISEPSFCDEPDDNSSVSQLPGQSPTVPKHANKSVKFDVSSSSETSEVPSEDVYCHMLSQAMLQKLEASFMGDGLLQPDLNYDDASSEADNSTDTLDADTDAIMRDPCDGERMVYYTSTLPAPMEPPQIPANPSNIDKDFEEKYIASNTGENSNGADNCTQIDHCLSYVSEVLNQSSVEVNSNSSRSPIGSSGASQSSIQKTPGSTMDSAILEGMTPDLFDSSQCFSQSGSVSSADSAANKCLSPTELQHTLEAEGITGGYASPVFSPSPCKQNDSIHSVKANLMESFNQLTSQTKPDRKRKYFSPETHSNDVLCMKRKQKSDVLDSPIFSQKLTTSSYLVDPSSVDTEFASGETTGNRNANNKDNYNNDENESSFHCVSSSQGSSINDDLYIVPDQLDGTINNGEKQDDSQLSKADERPETTTVNLDVNNDSRDTKSIIDKSPNRHGCDAEILDLTLSSPEPGVPDAIDLTQSSPDVCEEVADGRQESPVAIDDQLCIQSSPGMPSEDIWEGFDDGGAMIDGMSYLPSPSGSNYNSQKLSVASQHNLEHGSSSSISMVTVTSTSEGLGNKNKVSTTK